MNGSDVLLYLKMQLQFRILFIFFLLTVKGLTLMGQSIALQSFTQAAGYLPIQSKPIQLDWQLDLGLTTLAWKPSPGFLFTPGFIQPVIYRFSGNNKPPEFDPTISITYNDNAQSFLFISKEADLILLGYQVLDFTGRPLFTAKTKIASSHLALSIPVASLSSGMYCILIYYLPENMASAFSNNYWIKSFKIFKQ